MTKPSIIITGANGFIGESLVSYFLNLGWRVKALVHHLPEKPLDEVVYIKYDLAEKINQAIFEPTDFLVHCAYLKYERNKNSDAINLNGTKELISVCRKNNCKIIFLSTFSAHVNAKSHYGKTKLACEKLFDTAKDVILRPGLVVGKRGLASTIIFQMKNANYFPLVEGGKQPIQTIAVNDLCMIVEKICSDKINGEFYVAEEQSITLKEFYLEIAKQLNKKVRFVSVSGSLLFSVCRFAEMLGMRMPVSSESVLGLKQLKSFDTKQDLNRLSIKLKSYKENINAIIPTFTKGE